MLTLGRLGLSMDPQRRRDGQRAAQAGWPWGSPGQAAAATARDPSPSSKGPRGPARPGCSARPLPVASLDQRAGPEGGEEPETQAHTWTTASPPRPETLGKGQGEAATRLGAATSSGGTKVTPVTVTLPNAREGSERGLPAPVPSERTGWHHLPGLQGRRESLTSERWLLSLGGSRGASEGGLPEPPPHSLWAVLSRTRQGPRAAGRGRACGKESGGPPAASLASAPSGSRLAKLVLPPLPGGCGTCRQTNLVSHA